MARSAGSLFERQSSGARSARGIRLSIYGSPRNNRVTEWRGTEEAMLLLALVVYRIEGLVPGATEKDHLYPPGPTVHSFPSEPL